MVSARLQVGQNWLEVVLQKQHTHHKDVSAGDVCLATREFLRIGSVFRRRMDGKTQAGTLSHQRITGLDGRAVEVRVHGQDDHFDRTAR